MKIAICVCTCKRPISLGLLLGSLANLRSDRLSVESVELIVIDNNPNGIARYVCQSASSRLSIGLYFDEEPQRGISFARNRAVNVALAHRADFVAFIDDDDIPRPDWLSHLLNKQKQSGADIVFGRWLFAIRSDVSTWIKDNAQFRTSDYRKKNIHTLPCWASTCNVLINSRLLEAMRNDEEVFSPEFAFLGGEDTDFFIRALSRGASYTTSFRSIVLRHDVGDRFTTMGLLRRSFRQGCSKVSIMKRHRPSSEVRKLRRDAWRRLLTAAFFFPVYLFSVKFAIRQLSRASKSVGIIYGYSGRHYNYYQKW